MYSYDHTKIHGRDVSKFDIITKLQELSIDIAIETIEKVIEKIKLEKIGHPIAYLKTAMFNEIDEHVARIQAQLNYDITPKSNIDISKPNRNITRFHNFEERTSNYTCEEINNRVEEIARRKRNEIMQKTG